MLEHTGRRRTGFIRIDGASEHLAQFEQENSEQMVNGKDNT